MKKLIQVIGATLIALLRPLEELYCNRSPLVMRVGAVFGDQQTFNMTAAADLSGKQYHFVRGSAAFATNQASDATASSVLGVLQNKPASGREATIAFMGGSKVVAGGAITANDIITTNSSGRAATVASGQMGLGRAFEAAAADGDIISCLLFPPVRWTGAA
jgi:hypothetical protein